MAAAVHRSVGNGVHHVETGRYLTKQRVVTLQAHTLRALHDKELTAIGVGSRVGHGQRTDLEGFRAGVEAGDVAGDLERIGIVLAVDAGGDHLVGERIDHGNFNVNFFILLHLYTQNIYLIIVG